MKLIDVAEIVAGLAIAGKITPATIPVSLLPRPYDKVVKILQDGGDLAKIITDVGLDTVRTCNSAVEMSVIEGNTTVDWLSILTDIAGKSELADKLETEAKKLRAGLAEDSGGIISALRSRVKDGTKYSWLDQVDGGVPPILPTYYPPIDDHLCGIPDSSLTIVGASPASGKTSLALKIMTNRSVHGKKSLFFTFEMTKNQVKNRAIQIAKEHAGLIGEHAYGIEVTKNILTNDSIMTVDEVYADATRLIDQEGISLVCLDFADLLVNGEETEQNVAHVYKTCAFLAKETGCSVLLLSQLSRAYVGGTPKINHLRWSGLAEALGAMILLLYNPNQTYIDPSKDSKLPPIPGFGYIIAGKSRFGFGNETSPGAIRVEFNGEEGWGNESYGYTLLGG